MAAEHGPTAGEYIVHHLTHLQNHKASNVVDFTVFNFDSMFWAISLGVIGCWLLWLAARKATSGESLLGHYEKQTFSADKYNLDVDLTYVRDSKMVDGAMIERGVMRSRDAKGAVTIVPVGGMIGCKPA